MKTRKVIPKSSRRGSSMRPEKDGLSLDAAGNHGVRVRMPIGTCLRIGNGKRFPRLIRRALKVNDLDRSAVTAVDAAEETVAVVIVVETNVRDRRIARQPSNDRPETNIAPRRPVPIRQAIPANGRLVRVVGIVPVTIVVHEKTGRAVSVVPYAMIGDATNLGRSRQPANQRFNQPHLRMVVSRISGAEFSTSNQMSRHLHRASPLRCVTVNLVKNPLPKVHKRRTSF